MKGQDSSVADGRMLLEQRTEREAESHMRTAHGYLTELPR